MKFLLKEVLNLDGANKGTSLYYTILYHIHKNVPVHYKNWYPLNTLSAPGRLRYILLTKLI